MTSCTLASTKIERNTTDRPVANNTRYVNPLNKALKIFFQNAVSISLKNPSHAIYFLKTANNQQKAARLRKHWGKKGLHVPPMMIVSITNRCNLHCKGCYHQALRDVTRPEMSGDKLRSVIAEGKDLGTSFVILAGGEPLIRPDILEITQSFPEIIFFMFTNGLMITDEIADRFKEQRNVVPLISLEGNNIETNDRRGSGVYDRLQTVIARLKKQDIFFGISTTVTSFNYNTVINDEFVSHLTGLGCKLLLFAEYTPVKAETEDWVITEIQREQMNYKIKGFRSRYPALFVAVPGDEQEYGGCLSAGRGFIHISVEGDVEPCPFAPYSDSNIRDNSLKIALQSNLLKAIRENKELGKETGGACALYTHREWVKSITSMSSAGILTTD
jgi:MoaA/NifB/PqqE/SkfB family radical SAM enzyme